MPYGLSYPAAESLGNFFLQAAAAPTYPANWYVAIFTAPANPDGTGGIELSDPQYARLAMPRATGSGTGVGIISPGTYANNQELDFHWTSTAFSIQQVNICDAASGGNVIMVGRIDPSVTNASFTPGDQIVLPVQSVVFSTLGPIPSGLTTPAAEALMNYVLQGAAAPTYPASWWVGLHSFPYQLNGTGGTEANGNAYARVGVTRSAPNFPKVGSGTWQTGIGINYNSATGPYTVVQAGLWDAATGGNLRAIAPLDTAKNFVNGSTVKFDPGALTFRMVQGASVTLSWDNAGDQDVIGYKIYIGYATQNYVTSIDVGNVLSYRIDNLPAGRSYYFALTSYSSSLTESDFSDEVIVVL